MDRERVMTLEFSCNGTKVRADAEPGMRALDLIRDVLGLTGTKEGCGRGECGACTILVDGAPVNSCLFYAAKLDGKQVLTIEGMTTGAALAADDGVKAESPQGEGTGSAATGLHPLQEAFLDEGAVQCGFCTPGMILSAKALLDRNPDPSAAQIEEALSGNFCRCTGYGKIINAIRIVAKNNSRPK